MFVSSMLSLAYVYYESSMEMKKHDGWSKNCDISTRFRDECMKEVDECIEEWGKHGYEKIPPEEFRSQEVRDLIENDRHVVIVLRKKRNECLMEDFTILIERLHKSKRVTASKALVNELVSEYGHERVCLVGHSLGAAIAFLIAREFYLVETQSLEGHYFNLPFMCLETICREILDIFEWEYTLFMSVVNFLQLKPLLNWILEKIKCRLSCLQRETSQKAAEEFNQLEDWKPNIYVNVYDRVSRSYITYFQEACSKVHEPNVVGKSGVSLFTTILRTLRIDSKAHHLIPSCNLFITEKGFSTFNSHSLKNWETVKARHLRLLSYRSFNLTRFR